MPGVTTERRPTIDDVARLAGVSTGTVSNVLSGSRYVRPETRARVEQAFAQLEFRPSRIARALTVRRTLTVAMLVPDITNPFFASLIQGVEQALAPHGYVLVVANAGNDGAVEERYLAEFGERRVDGLVAATAGVAPEVLLRVAAITPTVLVDRTIEPWPGDAVVDDDRAGIGAVVEHLVGLGHRDCALLDGERFLSTAKDRLAGMQDALARHGLEPWADSAGPFTLDSGYERAHELLADPSHRPTAVCAANDLLAMGVLRAAGDLAIRVPADLSVTGYDDIQFAAFTSPPLTTVRQPAGTIAARIVDLLHGRMSDPAQPGRRIVVEPELVVRSSTAPPRNRG